MDSVRLKISMLDWLYIILIGACFGFLISLFIYFINEDLQDFSTIFFSILSAVSISFFAFILITVSNDYILPRVNEKFWYLISFIFSFFAGFLGFSFSYYVFSLSDYNIINLIKPYWFNISITIGFLTFLVGMILHQFISMKYRNESITSEVLETKIKALEGELNPHFLFNALNSLSELIYIDQKKAEKATLDISTFLRNAITKDSLIPLETEIKMVETYLDIENIRFDNNIRLTSSFDEESGYIQVPKFSIQLLVENAIKHGYISETLNIDIKADKNHIKVSNDGVLPKEVKFGTGLNNLQKRLQLLNIGKLEYKIEKEKMSFIIKIKR
ncbi:histidine kinase [Arcobacter sp. CECT 8983]|uniref:sensor histidine kinase n=1 Tax=Arcobacter sp. CECT 8983 TaxID=2044508 RepID=UPI00100A4E46|nr:histidine kinase [Arcobacter sp. CECT 8983]RXJ89628.1 histidine kinase [Arcobacter sp. CECT 8983]